MALPFFFIPTYTPSVSDIQLDEENSRHIIQVLRMQKDEQLQLTDGKGALLTAVIIDDHKKKCQVKVLSAAANPPKEKKTAIAISPLKNASRFEWFLEKATEIGVTDIIPLLCERTEKTHIRIDRLQNILISAMLQSQQTWLPILHEPQPFLSFTTAPPTTTPASSATARICYIAHCLPDPQPTTSLAAAIRQHPSTDTLIAIGPEGDFSPKEVASALEKGFIPVSLGPTRLRTETAGIVAATLLCIQ